VIGGPGHLGDRLTALVDGQLDHADRDRVLAHLARCAECRREAAEQRALKVRLDRLDVRAPGGLEGRLLALSSGYGGLPVPPPAPFPVASAGASPAVGAPTVPSVTAGSSAVGSPTGRLRPPTAALGALLLVGVGVGVLGPALDEDGPVPPRRDPNQPGLVVEHATATTQVPLSDPAVVGAAWTSAPARPLPGPAVPVPARHGTGGAAGGVVPVGASVRDR
jgi:anti-sigma factor RsiW